MPRSRLLTLALAAALIPQLAAAFDFTIDEWEVPWLGSRPRDPYVAPDGRVWFVGQKGDYAANFDPETGGFRQFPLDPGTGPHNLIVGRDGRIWIAGNLRGYIGELDPATGKVRQIPLPDPQARDPHTLALAADGTIWFTVQQGNFIGHLDPATGIVRLAPVPTVQARPYGIVVDRAGVPWVAEFGAHKLATVDPIAFTVREIPLPRENTRPRRLALTANGDLWYVDYLEGYLGRYRPATGDVKEWRAPAGEDSGPYAMAIDDRDRIWFVETGLQPNRFAVFDTETETFIATKAIRSGAGAVRHMHFDPKARAIWFGTDANTLGRVRVPK